MSLTVSIAPGVSLYIGGWLLAYFLDEPGGLIAMVVITVVGMVFGIVYGAAKFLLGV